MVTVKLKQIATVRFYASVAQLEEHPAFNRNVAGSSPAGGTV